MAFLFTFQILQKPLRHRPLLPHRRQVEGLPLGCLFKSLQQQATATTIIITTTIIVNTNLSVRPETVAMKHFCQMMIRPHQQSKGRLLKSFTRPSPTGKLIFFGSYICIIVMDRVSKEEEKNYLQFSNFEISCRYLGNSNISRD